MPEQRKLVQYEEHGMLRQRFDPLPFFKALRVALRAALTPIREAAQAFRYTYRNARMTSPPVRGRPMPLSDPTECYEQEAGVEPMPQDDVNIVLYRDHTGQLFTPAMLTRLNGMTDDQVEAERKAGRYVPTKGAITNAYECSDERAQEIVERLEFIEMEAGLTDPDRELLKFLRVKLVERYAH